MKKEDRSVLHDCTLACDRCCKRNGLHAGHIRGDGPYLPYRTISLDEIYEAVWNAPSHGDVRTVISHVYNLRKKLEVNPQKPRFIRSVRGYGYFFSPDGEDVNGQEAKRDK